MVPLAAPAAVASLATSAAVTSLATSAAVASLATSAAVASLATSAAVTSLAAPATVPPAAPSLAASLPDITVLGRWTYLATEVVFGSVAVALAYRAGALRRAARTIVVLYPVAYLWDWYTLEVGVFAIPMRTGIEVLWIPLEEHLFMIVVPLLVIGLHETLHGPPDETGTAADEP